VNARPRVLFLGSGFAGHRTRFLNLQRHVQDDGRVEPVFGLVSGWKDGGLVERLPFARGARGAIRSALEASSLATMPRPDAIWTAAGTSMTPWLWSQLPPLRRPLVVDFDWTVSQREAWSREYFGRPPRRGMRRALALRQERLLWRAASILTPWSRWAATSVEAAGVPAKKVTVIPPGVDLDAWPAQTRRARCDGPLRLLFVGGDLDRKGGQLLADVVSTHFAGRCELDVVTHGDLAPSPAVRVHRASPNTPELRALYERADMFAMPSLADCFGIATVEAMASALPAIVSDVGAASEIVDEGETGWLITPDPASVRAGIERALAQRDRLPAMGARARAVAEERFDGRRNDRAVVDVIVEALAASRSRRRIGAKA
jgi:glycosyltransferase involved in cell wall biosynthesis